MADTCIKLLDVTKEVLADCGKRDMETGEAMVILINSLENVILQLAGQSHDPAGVVGCTVESMQEKLRLILAGEIKPYPKPKEVH